MLFHGSMDGSIEKIIELTEAAIEDLLLFICETLADALGHQLAILPLIGREHPAFAGDRNDCTAIIARVRMPFDQAVLLQLLDQRGSRRPADLQILGDLADGPAFFVPQKIRNGVPVSERKAGLAVFPLGLLHQEGIMISFRNYIIESLRKIIHGYYLYFPTMMLEFCPPNPNALDMAYSSPEPP